ncbi:MAG: N-acetylmuramic acid 6-phosphate etherase [Phycisphaerales bacterium]|nr:N-acetylmuramic acid 6-phosphate etherase [Phycisphaerales bacterium]
MHDRGHLDTEQRNPRSMHLDRLSTAEAFDIMSAEDQTVALAVARAKPDICRAIDLIVSAFERGGRLIYIGAGTSGRLGVLDAAECPPTFLTDPSMVRAVIAGGEPAIRRSVEGAEDDVEAGAEAVRRLGVGDRDVVFGISSGGTTPFVQGALRQARESGAKTVFFACVPREQFPGEADVSIRVLTGPEVLTGSTRLKAGTATKLVLNMVTTLSMTRLGKVHENLMVDVNCNANAKLTDRGVRILQSLTQLDRAEAGRLLQQAGGRVKSALVMHAAGLSREEADQRLARSGGRIALALDSDTH